MCIRDRAQSGSRNATHSNAESTGQQTFNGTITLPPGPVVFSQNLERSYLGEFLFCLCFVFVSQYFMIGFHQPHHSLCSNCSTERLPQVYGNQSGRVPGLRDYASVSNPVQPRGSVLSVGCETGSASEQVHNIIAEVHREGGDVEDLSLIHI